MRRIVVTDKQWLACKQPKRMLDLLSALFGNVQQRGKKKRRKLALFGVACCRHIPGLCNEKSSSIAIDISERYAERKAKIDDVRNAVRKTGPPRGDYSHYDRAALDRYLAEHAVLCNAAFNPVLVSEYALKASLDRAGERAHQCALLRDIFGNPFRPERLDPRWLTSTVLDLARTIYDERAYERMPILADALMDAGCDSEEVINHCRGPGPHVRGCWVVDLLTGRE